MEAFPQLTPGRRAGGSRRTAKPTRCAPAISAAVAGRPGSVPGSSAADRATARWHTAAASRHTAAAATAGDERDTGIPSGSPADRATAGRDPTSLARRPTADPGSVQPNPSAPAASGRDAGNGRDAPGAAAAVGSAADAPATPRWAAPSLQHRAPLVATGGLVGVPEPG